MKKKILLVLVFILIPFVSIWLCSFGDKDSNEENKISKKSTIAMYVEGEDGEYSQSNESSFPKEGYVLNIEKSSCRNGGSLLQDSSTKAISLSVGNAESCTLYFDKDESSASKDTLAILGITSNGEKNNFNEPATTDEGVFEMEDDYGTSYYYRGAVENNYVKFAGFYWRIIRVNGDGSLRIIYDGTKAYVNGVESMERVIKTNQTYNYSNDNKYMGWMYGPAGTTASTSKEEAQTNVEDSTIKGVVDAWYKTNIVDKGYENAVSDTLFCNDRSTPGKIETGWIYDTGLGYGNNNTAYGAAARASVYNGIASVPTFKCPQKNDAFTVNDINKGNGALTYPVGLITADEIIAAGSGKGGTTNNKYYLYKSSRYSYWSLSPCVANSAYSQIFLLNFSGGLSYNPTASGEAVAPVINLSAEHVKTLSGTGTMTDPYQTV